MQMRTDGPIKTRREGAILEVTLDRPKANAIDLATSRIMGLTFRDFRDDDSLRVAILRAEGEKFKLDVQALDRALNQSVREARAGIPGGQTQTIPLGETEEERRERKLIAKLDMAGELRPGHLIKALREKRLSMFVSVLATLGRFDPMDIRKAIQAGSPELLAMACAAIGLDKTAFPAILSLLRDINKGRPGGDEEAVRKATATLAQLGPGVAVTAFRKGVTAL
jgi:hypothetical protein